MSSTPSLPGWRAGTWTVDPMHSHVGFSVRHLMSKVRGRFTEFTGRITTEDDPAQSEVTASVALSSVDTGSDLRDNHLRSGDYFDVAQNPTMAFTSTTVSHDGERWLIAGDLTIKDITKAVEFEVEYLGIDPTGVRGETRIGFSATTSLSRLDFGVSFGLATDGKIMVGDRVDVTLDIEAVLEQ